jgi:putative membrane protein
MTSRDATGDQTGWRRLSVRVVYMDLVRVLLALIPGYLGTVVFNDGGPFWPLVIGSCAGVLGAFADFRRWVTTRYRVAPDRVEMRSGWLVKKHRTVTRDLIRSVDSTAKARHRLFRLQVVHIGSGRPDSSFGLDALDQQHAEHLRRQLVHRPEPEASTEPEPAEVETVLARLRWDWLPLNIVNLWAPFVVAGPVFGLYWFLRPFGVDLLDVARGLLPWASMGVLLSVVVCLVVAFPIGVAGLAGTFILENWNLVLARVGEPPHTALVTRRGLLNTRTTQRNDDRLRGLSIKEPLVWRWLRLAEIGVLTTGLGQSGGGSSGALLPRIRVHEARRLATQVLPDGHRPMAAELARHPRGALLRRLGWATYGPALASATLLLFALSGALPGWVSPLPLTLLPLTVPLAVASYRALGHAWAKPYLVVRRGAMTWHTVALQERAVIGWTLRQSLLQRWGNRMTAGVSTAAGSRHYEVPDAGVDQALALLRAATPLLAAQILEPVPSRAGDAGTGPGGSEVPDDRVGHPVVQGALTVAEEHERVDPEIDAETDRVQHPAEQALDAELAQSHPAPVQRPAGVRVGDHVPEQFLGRGLTVRPGDHRPDEPADPQRDDSQDEVQ